jgi:phospholipid/cholesterol/gamma-HCH transport system substrate-binding protein
MIVEKKSVGIGLFVIGGLMLFGVGMFLIGDRHQMFTRHVEYYSEFVNLAGITTGAKVRVAGMDAGQVLAITVPDSPSSRFRLKWRIDAELQGLVRTDSMASIGTEGVVGGTFLGVDAGSAAAPQANALTTIPSREPIQMSALLEGGVKLLDDAKGTMTDMRAKLGAALDTITSMVSNANDLVVGLEAGRGTAGMLLRDDALAGRIRTAVEHAEQATANIDRASSQADALMTDLRSQQIPQRAGAIIDQVADSSRQIHQVIADFTQPDDQGMSAGANIRESLTNANTAAANLADATEALKHNFLTRGFFKNRGYYSLADLSPDQYRQDRALARRTQSRVWLSGSELFQHGADGSEELSANGVALLNRTFTEHTDAIAERPVVVEGYGNGDVPSDRFQVSRRRAFVVRQYLQAHFQLELKNLGAVPMKNAPPIASGRATWDGICLVLLKKS